MAQGLGRGLGSLIPKKTVEQEQNNAGDFKGEEKKLAEVVFDGERVLQIDPSQIDLNPYQPRTYFSDGALNDLAESIKQHGIIQPLVVTKKEGGRYELIAGERRLRSSRLVGLKKVPVLIRDESKQKKLELALIENLQRENLNPIESARAYKQLIEEFTLTQDEVAKKVGKARSSVANALRLLSLPQEAQNALFRHDISEAHAKQLLSLESEDKQLKLLTKILRHNLTVSETGKEIKRTSSNKSERIKSSLDRSKEAELERVLSTKVEIKRKLRGGQVLIDFYSDEDLGDIIKKISQ